MPDPGSVVLVPFGAVAAAAVGALMVWMSAGRQTIQQGLRFGALAALATVYFAWKSTFPPFWAVVDHGGGRSFSLEVYRATAPVRTPFPLPLVNALSAVLAVLVGDRLAWFPSWLVRFVVCRGESNFLCDAAWHLAAAVVVAGGTAALLIAHA